MYKITISISLETMDTAIRALGELPLKLALTAFQELAEQRRLAMLPEPATMNRTDSK